MSNRHNQPDNSLNETHQIPFGVLDRHTEIEISSRNLPHWLQVGAAMFVTFRTNDSLPKAVILRWYRELETWLKIRRLPYQLASSVVGLRMPDHDVLLEQLTLSQQREFKKLSDCIFHHALDECHGACLLKQPPLAKIVADAIRYYDGSKYDLDRFVIMPNHVHAIVQFRDDGDLTTVGQSWMRYTARQINAAIGRKGDLWQPEPFDHIIRSEDQFHYLQEYTSANPAKAKLTEGEFLFWERM